MDIKVKSNSSQTFLSILIISIIIVAGVNCKEKTPEEIKVDLQAEATRQAQTQKEKDPSSWLQMRFGERPSPLFLVINCSVSENEILIEWNITSDLCVSAVGWEPIISTAIKTILKTILQSDLTSQGNIQKGELKLVGYLFRNDDYGNQTPVVAIRANFSYSTLNKITLSNIDHVELERIATVWDTPLW